MGLKPHLNQVSIYCVGTVPAHYAFTNAAIGMQGWVFSAVFAAYLFALRSSDQ